MKQDLTTLLAERDALIHKMELEKLRDENLNLIQQIKDKIDNAKAEITESAITKTMFILDKTRLWLIFGSSIFAIFIAAAGFIGYKSINTELTDYYINTVHHWLRFDSSESGGSKVLNDLRTSALLDSLTLKYERDKATSSSVVNINLTPEERQRLMSLILNPSTDDQQYKDALHIVMVNRGMYGRFYEDDIGKKIASILSNKEFSDNKRLDVLNAMTRDRALFPWALAIINDSNFIDNEAILMSAFRNVGHFDKARAIKFAEKNINNFKSIYNRTELGVFLINNDTGNNEVNNLISLLKERKDESISYGDLISTRIKKGLNDQNISSVAKYISEQLKDGLKMELSTDFYKKPVLSFSIKNAIYPFREPEKLFQNSELINAIIKERPLTFERLFKLTLFFQLQDRGYWITTLMLKPEKGTELVLANNTKVLGSEILNYVWLRAEEKAGKMTLIATWRNKDGTIFEMPISDIHGSEACHYVVDFNREQLRSYTWTPDYDYLDDYD